LWFSNPHNPTIKPKKKPQHQKGEEALTTSLCYQLRLHTQRATFDAIILPKKDKYREMF
jgi:hypothetical protein